jgi:heme/copper-type cytochrome/quinol oxidase subunit 2
LAGTILPTLIVGAPVETPAKVPMPMAEAKPRKVRRTRNVLAVLIVLLIGAGVVVAFVAPQVFRVRGVQAPVNVTIREGMLSAYVIQVQNLSRDHLAEVVVTASREMRSQSQSGRIPSMAPGAVVELGALEWNWQYQPGDTITVTASGYLPIVFKP